MWPESGFGKGRVAFDAILINPKGYSRMCDPFFNAFFYGMASFSRCGVISDTISDAAPEL